MFPCMITKAATVDVICSGEGSNRDGAVQLVSDVITLYMIRKIVEVIFIEDQSSIFLIVAKFLGSITSLRVFRISMTLS